MLEFILLREILIPSILDFLLILFFAFAIFRGYSQGIIVQTISLFALLAGVYISAIVATSFYDVIVGKSRDTASSVPVIIFTLLFAGVVFFSNWSGVYVKKMVTSLKNNIFSRFWGAFFAFIKYLFIISIVFMLINRLDKKLKIFSDKSSTRLFYPIASIAPTVMPKLEFNVRQTAPIELNDITNEPEYVEELDSLED